MYFTLRSAAVSAVCLLATAGASAATLYQQQPTDVANSQQSDASVAIYGQSVPALGSVTVDKISWWGFHGQNSGGSAFDSFEVFVNGAQQTGALTASIDQGLDFFTLDIQDIALSGAATLEIWNNSLDVEWFWAGSTGAGETAFRLEGTRNGGGSVPEPGVLALLGLSGLGLCAARRKSA
jgi:hypothetical protein